MTEYFPKDVLFAALGILEMETEDTALLSALSSALTQATVSQEPHGHGLRVSEGLVALRSAHGTLTFFWPPSLVQGQMRRLASFDRGGRLLVFLHWNPEGKLTHFKVRGPWHSTAPVAGQKDIPLESRFPLPPDPQTEW